MVDIEIEIQFILYQNRFHYCLATTASTVSVCPFVSVLFTNCLRFQLIAVCVCWSAPTGRNAAI